MTDAKLCVVVILFQESFQGPQSCLLHCFCKPQRYCFALSTESILGWRYFCAVLPHQAAAIKQNSQKHLVLVMGFSVVSQQQKNADLNTAFNISLTDQGLSLCAHIYVVVSGNAVSMPGHRESIPLHITSPASHVNCLCACNCQETFLHSGFLIRSVTGTSTLASVAESDGIHC